MPPIALWLCFAALAQPRRFRQPQKLDASRSSQKAVRHLIAHFDVVQKSACRKFHKIAAGNALVLTSSPDLRVVGRPVFANEQRVSSAPCLVFRLREGAFNPSIGSRLFLMIQNAIATCGTLLVAARASPADSDCSPLHTPSTPNLRTFVRIISPWKTK